MKQKTVYAEYDAEKGTTILTIQNKYGTFTAQCKVSEHDKDIQNRWDGFKFCEYKIYIQTLKTKHKKLLARAEAMEILYNQWADWSLLKERNEDFYCEEDFETAEFLFSQMSTAFREAAEVKKQCNILKQRYNEVCDNILDERRKAREMKK